MRELAAAHGVAALYVSHDLAVVAGLATLVAVMYAERAVELGLADELFESSAHPYTRRLAARSRCAFAPRSELHLPECDADVPPLVPLTPVHSARCIRAKEVVRPTRAMWEIRLEIATPGLLLPSPSKAPTARAGSCSPRRVRDR